MPLLSPCRFGIAAALLAFLSGCDLLHSALFIPRDFPPPQVTLTDRWLVIDGIVVSDLVLLVRSMPDSVKLVILDSPGGLAEPGDAVAQEFRRRGITAYVPADSICYSACALMLAGAITRIVHPTARLMIHAGMVSDDVPTSQIYDLLVGANARMVRRFIEYGVDANFVRETVRLPRKKPERILMAEEAVAVGLATGIGILPEGDAAIE
ncbi:ATP-dependent protease ClpP protease subunit [Skermanella aerolata]|uniref:ATP-dependent Clp protease proteolytic subunit n=1 Tax=Skermanella aerolata TaxID=393310 RepID=UPI003D1D66C8